MRNFFFLQDEGKCFLTIKLGSSSLEEDMPTKEEREAEKGKKERNQSSKRYTESLLYHKRVVLVALALIS